MDRQFSSSSHKSEPKLGVPSSADCFDIVGNLPEDILAEVISHLTELEDLKRVISWQTVSSRWRTVLNDPSTRIYHQALLKNDAFRSLLPPTYYNSAQSSFSYAAFRRAIRTHVAIKNGNLKPTPSQYQCGGYGAGKVEAGPILADGFLVWLQKTTCPPGYKIVLKTVDLTKPATAEEPETGNEIEVAEFTCGGPEDDYKFQRNGYSVQWLDIITLNNMTWRALGSGGGLVAYWIAGDDSITILDLTTPSTPRKLPIAGLKPKGSKSQERYVNHLLISKDHLVVNLSRSSTFAVYSTHSSTLLHVLDVSPEVPDSLYNVFTGMLSGWRDKASCTLKIQDNYLIIACVMGMFFLVEDTTLRFKSWDLTSPPIYEPPNALPTTELKQPLHLESDIDSDTDSVDIPTTSQYRFADFEIPSPDPSTPASRPCDFLRPLMAINIQLSLPHTGLYGPKLLFQPNNQIQLYCQDNRSRSHPTHPLLRWSYPFPPTALTQEAETFCGDFVPTRRGYLRVLKEEGRMFDRFRKRYPTDVGIAGVRYELVLPPVPVSSGGTSTRWGDYRAWGQAKKCIRLQMRRDGEAKEEKCWDADVGIKVWRRHPHLGHGVSVAAGWEGVVVLWLDRILVWRWELEDEAERTVEKGVLKRSLRRLSRVL